MIFRKVFNDEVQKVSAFVCLFVHALRWIKPDNVSLSVFAAILCGVSCWFLAFSAGKLIFHRVRFV